ncbi:DUF1800 family protein [Prosthecobacter dejongeii]|uniref:Uncharacterized protein (DUF1800 family) n=1 Tax=Prosthecobacter dejongeii TaxID=48465 RepID=A0A7W7YHF6_9BACT|nr:DUF1800 family protein [Prosthecobacter dejongeii]MBB5036265.1 uncharacterized protein (DUF1800 family) [Prosthecobacter dejongeii]
MKGHLTLHAIVLGLLLGTPALQGEFTMLGSLGNQDGNPQEFGDGTWGTNAAPGSATALDNDYYFSGTYPAPIGLVAEAEPWTNLERTLGTGNPLTRLHFNLNAAQVTPTLRLRFVFHHVWGGWSEPGYGAHELEVRLNGTVLKTETATTSGTVVVEANAGSMTPLVGENILQVARIGGAADGWVQLDSLTLEIHPTALVDADGDGLPRWWEEDHGLSDAVTADAVANPDQDGLTNLQEYALKTDPRVADTDGDGLKDGREVELGTQPLLADTDGDTLTDGEETTATPPTNPLLADTDNDGAPDAWELRTGFNATSATHTPPVWSGSIGLNFVSELNPENALAARAVTGFAPQMNWNSTIPLTSWNSATGTHQAVASPVAGVLVNSAGTPTAMTMSWSSTSGFWASGHGGSSTGKLFDGFFSVNNDTGGTLTFSQVPYATYDVIVYVGSVYDGAKGRLRLNDQATSDRWFVTSSTAPETRFIQPLISSEAVPWRGNTIRFRNISGSSFNLKLFRTSWYEVGIHGVQIVDATANADNDGMPTWWELAHKLNPAANDAATDLDGDLLDNLGEWTRQTDPHVADTDGDGLTDDVETSTGQWVSATDTGSSPLLADTDSDGLADGEEVNRLPQPTNPNLADSDGDGRSDRDEIRQSTNPVEADAANAQMPIVTTSPRNFIWVVDNVQLVWDHTRGHVVDMPWGDNQLMNFRLANAANPGRDAFQIALRVKGGRVSHFLYSSYENGFSHPDNDGWDIWEADWNEMPTDHKAALGFSGHGRADISDRLRFQILGTSPGAQTNWTFTFSLINQDTGSTVIERTFVGCHLATNVHTNAVNWQDLRDPPNANRLEITRHVGVQMFFQSTPLEDTPAFAAYKDTDEDGMPDVWEDAYTLDKNNATNASVDSDVDGLTNLQEYLAGTSPRDRDSDDDGAPDGLEMQNGSHPLQASSLPPFYHGTPSLPAMEDFNGNGMSDPWEYWAGGGILPRHLDADKDGLTNGDEAAAGTDPFNPQSRFWSTVEHLGTDVTVRWPTLNFKTGHVWESHNLSNWAAASGTPVPDGSNWTQTFANALQNPISTFYRLALEDVDSDGDGVSDWTEVNVLGSNPQIDSSIRPPVFTDLNGDGVPDAEVGGDLVSLLEQFGQGSSAASAGQPAIMRSQASRFLMQAAFGPTLEDIHRVQTLGYADWIAEQVAKPPTLHSTYIQGIYDDMLGQRSQSNFNRGGEIEAPFLFGNNMMTAFARASIQGEDQLRQRVAFALSQILVTSRRDANLESRCLGMADYYDVLVRHAFGNYHDLLMKVTLHPVMGRYLSHVGNQKADPSINRYPDENYAREIMQLFTIGLWELNPDGTQKLNGQGQSIPTYTNAEITQLARVMTGFWFGGHTWGGGGWTEQDLATPMTLRGQYHDFGKKTLLGGYIIPARAATDENAERDVSDAVRHLFKHPNTPIFVGRQLIQFLVTDNPSPAYIQRIAAVFADNGEGVRGDLKSVVTAILLDEEARDPRITGRPSYGRLKEPVIRTMALARAFGLKEVPDLLWWDWGDFFNASRQEPTFSPSVFNFYRPDYRAPGLLTQNNLAGPVFQITDSFSSISFPNRLWQTLMQGFSMWETYRFPLDLSREKALASTPADLVDHLNLLFCAGQMRPSTRMLILGVINQIPAQQTSARVQVAAYLALVCPEGAVMR